MKKILAILLTLALCLSMLAACGSKQAAGEAPAEEAPAEAPAEEAPAEEAPAEEAPAEEAPAEEAPAEKVQVVYWGTWGSEKQEYIERLAGEFNAMQDQYELVYEYVGNATDLLAKIQITDSENLPAMINATTEQAGTYMYSDFVVPISTFAASSRSIGMLSK